MKFVLGSVAAALVSGLVGCSVSVDGPGGTILKTGGGTSAKKSYELKENGCATGFQEFKADSDAEAQAQLCEGLRSASRNNFCAYNLRKMQWQAECGGGVFTETP